MSKQYHILYLLANSAYNQDYDKAKRQVSSSNAAAIRGWEQKLIEQHGGAQSKGGTAGNQINGISDKNPRKDHYHEAARKEFGKPQ